MIKKLLGLISAAALAFPASAGASEDPSALIEAMDIDSSMLVSGSLQTPDSTATMFDVRSSLGVVTPYNAPTMALLSTGSVDNITEMVDYDYPGDGVDTNGDGIQDSGSGDRATLQFDINVPPTANSFSFNFYFMSREYPEWVGSKYNDAFEVYLTSGAYTGQIVFDSFGNLVTVNNALFTVTADVNGDGIADTTDPSNPLLGTGFDADGGTGWVTTIAPCVGGETMRISFEIYDVADGIWDSAVLLDNFQFSENEVEDGPVTEDDTPDEPMVVAYVTPKEGGLDDGIGVTIMGDGFSNNVQVYFGEVQIAAASITPGSGGESLIIDSVPAASSPGSVNVRLVRGTEEAELTNGYTYWNWGEGSASPRVTSITPSEAHPDGGTELQLRGANFNLNESSWSGRVLFRDVDGEELAEVEAEVVPSDDEGLAEDASVDCPIGALVCTLAGGVQQIRVVAPEHAEGWVDVVVVNSAGLESAPGYPFVYSDGASQSFGDGGNLAPGPNCSVTAELPLDRTWMLLLVAGLGAGVLRRREVVR